MTADGMLILIAGIVAGFCLGHLQSWRFARKLEAHRVRLSLTGTVRSMLKCRRQGS